MRGTNSIICLRKGWALWKREWNRKWAARERWSRNGKQGEALLRKTECFPEAITGGR